MGSETRLDEFDKAEWFDVTKRVRPSLSQSEFDELWAKFQRAKQTKTAQ